MRKQVKITPIYRDFYFTLYNHIFEHHKLPSKLLSKQALNYYVSRLKKEGFIGKKGYGVWDILKPYEQVKTTPIGSGTDRGGVKVFTSSNDIRGHAFQYRIRLPKIKNWANRTAYLTKKGIKFKAFNRFQSISYKGFKVWLYDKALVIYVPNTKSYFSNKAETSQKFAIYELIKLLGSLEHYLGVSFKVNGQYQFKVSKQHYAKIKDALATQCNKEGVKIYCYFNGEGWLTIDNSKGYQELEATHPITSPKDMDKIIVPFMNDLKTSYEKTGELFTPSIILNILNGVLQNQVRFDANMQSHIVAVQNLGLGVGKLNKSVDRLLKVINSHFQVR